MKASRYRRIQARTGAEWFASDKARLQELFRKHFRACTLCGYPMSGGRDGEGYHEECRPVSRRIPGLAPGMNSRPNIVGHYAPNVIERELTDSEPIIDDPWCPDLANGVCCHCEQASRDGWLLCPQCIHAMERNGPGFTPESISLRRAYR